MIIKYDNISPLDLAIMSGDINNYWDIFMKRTDGKAIYEPYDIGEDTNYILNVVQNLARNTNDVTTLNLDDYNNDYSSDFNI